MVSSPRPRPRTRSEDWRGPPVRVKPPPTLAGIRRFRAFRSRRSRNGMANFQSRRSSDSQIRPDLCPLIEHPDISSQYVAGSRRSSFRTQRPPFRVRLPDVSTSTMEASEFTAMTSTSFFDHAVRDPGHRDPSPRRSSARVPRHIACTMISVKPANPLIAEQPAMPPWPGRFAWAMHVLKHSSVRKGFVS
jgi:hypothetical protein